MQPDTPATNPYGAPKAHVDDHVPDDREALEVARRVPAGHALAWYRDAWTIFKASPGTWIAIWVAFFVLSILLSLVPIAGGLVVTVLTPVMLGGCMVAARHAERDGAARFGDLFACFDGRAGALLLVGILQLAVSIIVGIGLALLMAVYFGSRAAMFGDGPPADMTAPEQLGPMIVLGILAAAVFTPITNVVWLAAALAALDGASGIDALRRAFGATLRNLLPLLVLVVATLVLALAATIPVGLGWLVFGPVLLIMLYSQYRDLFGTAPREP